MKIRNIAQWMKGINGGKRIQYETMSYAEIQADLLSRIKNGRLEIPYGLTEIGGSMFDGHGYGNKEAINSIVCVHVPSTVKTIGERAFADCANLEKVTLEEGVEAIEPNAFTGCEKLKSIQIPKSVVKMTGWAFYGSGIEQSVIRADGKVFYYYPQKWDREAYRIPDGVEVIASRAFIDKKELKRMDFPRTLKKISEMAFIGCGFDEIELFGDVEIEKGAFSNYKRMVTVRWPEGTDAFSERRAYLRCNGRAFLAAVRVNAPENRYWKDEAFLKLAGQCAEGKVSAMDEMTKYFEVMAQETDDVFCKCAANFWRMRAYLYGSRAAEAYWTNWCETHPDVQPYAPVLNEDLKGAGMGEQLNALGFLFFDEGREYSLSGVDEEGVVEVSAWESEDGPDEDGFGREENYDWWYLNEFLIKPEGVDWVHGWSHNDKRCSEEKFKKIHDQVAKFGKIRKSMK